MNYVGPSGSLAPINDSLVADSAAGYALKNVANRYQVQLPSTLGTAPVKVGLGSSWLAFSLLGAAGTLSSSGSTATYRDALPGVTVSYVAQSDSVKETVTVASSAAPPSFSFAISASSDLRLSQNAGGEVAVSSEGAQIGLLQAPTMVDAAGKPGPIAMSLAPAGGGWTVTITPQSGWLSAPGRAFPVTVDPTVSFGALSEAGQQCVLNPSAPTRNSCGSLSDIGDVNGVAQLNLPSTVPYDAVVTDTDLSADVQFPDDGPGDDPTITVAPLTQAWTPSQVTWNQAASGSNWMTSGGTVSTDPAYQTPSYSAFANDTGLSVSWNSAQMVQDWLNAEGGGGAGIADDGIQFTSDNEVSLSNVGMVIDWTYRWGPTTDSTSLTDHSTLTVNPANENANVDTRVLSVAGTGENLSVDTYYNSLGVTGGSAWSFSVGPDINIATDSDNSAVVYEPGGGVYTYDRTSTATGTCVEGGTTYSSYYRTPPVANATLCETSSGFILTSDSSQTSLVFNNFGPLTSEVDRNGDTITYGYNSSGGLSSITDTQGRVFTVTEDPATHKINEIAGPSGATGAQYRTWQWNWASNGQLNSYTDAAGAVTHYNYDNNGNLDKILSPGTYIAGTLTPSEVDLAQTAGGQVEAVNRDAASCPSGSCTTTYATTAAPQPVTAGSNRCDSYANPTSTDSGPTTMVGCATITDPNGHETSYGWDTYDQLVKTVDPLNQVSQGTLNADGQPLTNTNNSGIMAASTYDSNFNQLSAAADPSASGQSAAMSDAVYATAAAPAVTGPAGSDIPGNQYLASTGTDANGNCATYAYDSNGNVTTQWTGVAATGSGGTRTCASPSSGSGAEIEAVNTYKGDSGATGCSGHDGELCTSTNGNGGTTNYTYNTVGQLIAVTPPSPQQSETITYDTNGRVSSITDGTSRTTTYVYDADDRVTGTNTNAASDPTCSTPSDCVDNVYDPNGNLASRVDGSGTTTKTYNLLNQLTAERLPTVTGNWICSNVSDALVYTYDADGNLASYCDAGGTVTYSYDPDNHNTGVADPGGSCTPGAMVQPCTTFAYSPTGQRTTISYPTSTGAVTTLGYDNAGNETTTSTAKSGVGTIVHLTYTYATSASPTVDAALRQTATNVETSTTTTYSYDSQNRLSCATTIEGNCATAGYQYTYDADGNRTSNTVSGVLTSYAYNAADESATGSATYNGAGDQTTTNNGTAISYNNFDQTTSIGPDRYSYGGVGQADLNSAGGSGLTNSSLLGVTAFTTSGNTYYVTRDAEGNLVTLRNGANSYYYLFDANNSVIGLLSAAGTSVAAYSYDPYGNLTSDAQNGVAATNPFRYDSGYQLESGFYHYGARYYDPATGSWTQLDPSGADPGYSFAGDDPINAVDTSGYSYCGPPEGQAGEVQQGVPCSASGELNAPNGPPVTLTVQYNYSAPNDPQYINNTVTIGGGSNVIGNDSIEPVTPVMPQPGPNGGFYVSGTFSDTYTLNGSPYTYYLNFDLVIYQNGTVGHDGSVANGD